MAASQKAELLNEFIDLDLDNSFPLKPRKFPVEGKDIDLKVKMLSNYIKEEQLFTPFKKEPELDDIALTNILTNLLIADEKGKWLAYHRDISQYSMYHKKYGFAYYTYERYIKIINALIRSRFVENHNGFFDRETRIGKISRMKLTDKLKAVLSRNHIAFETMQMDYFCVNEIGEFRYVVDNSLLRVTSKFPLVSVILKRKKKKQPIDYRLTTRVIQMIKQVDKYNKFISKALVVLPVETSDLTLKNIDPAVSVQVDDLSKVGQKYTLIPSRSSERDVVRFFRNLLAYSSEASAFNYPADVPFLEGMVHEEHVSPSSRKGNSKKKFTADPQKPWQPTVEVSNLPATNNTTILLSHQPIISTIATITHRNSTTSIRKLLACKQLRCKLYRVFNNSSFRQGGRFWAAEYQQLNSEKRSTILINSKPVIEADFSSFHTRMLYHLEGMECVNDPYDLFAGDRYLRKAVKSLMNKAINAPYKTKALYAFNNDLYKITEDEQENKDNSLIIEALRRRELSAPKLYDIIYNAHPAIQKYIGTSYGLTLMWYDSQIAAKVLTYFTNKEIPCLCVHDSFILPRQYGDELVGVMKQFYVEVMKKYCKGEFKFEAKVEFK
jgi:hypothetical protein